MEEFYIDVELSQGLTRIQVDEVPPEQWDLPYTPQFIIEYHDHQEFMMVTLQMDQGVWYDHNAHTSDDENRLRYFDSETERLNAGYQSPLDDLEIRIIGQAISRHMIVHLTAYMGLFIPAFREPSLN